MMMKRVRGQVRVTLGGEERNLRLGIGQLEQLELDTGHSPVVLSRLAGTGELKTSQARAVLLRGLEGAGEDHDKERLKLWMEYDGVMLCLQHALQCIVAAIYPDAAGNAEGDRELEPSTTTA